VNLRFAMFEILAALSRVVPRGKGLLYRVCGGGKPGAEVPAWRNLPTRYRVIRDRHIGAYVSLDLADWNDRRHYFFGYHGDWGNRLLARRCLTAGDTYIDIGANIGVHSLYASRIVGKEGRVIAFEPNPATFSLLSAHLAVNRIGNCTVHNLALSNEAGELELSATSAHSGTWTCRDVRVRRESIRVPVTTADEMIQAGDLRGRTLIKIDTEGFEHRIIQGMPRLLRADGVIGASLEVTDKWLRDAGTSAIGLFSDMVSAGYQPLLLRTGRRFGLARTLDLKPLERPLDDFQYDVFFARRTG